MPRLDSPELGSTSRAPSFLDRPELERPGACAALVCASSARRAATGCGGPLGPSLARTEPRGPRVTGSQLVQNRVRRSTTDQILASPPQASNAPNSLDKKATNSATPPASTRRTAPTDQGAQAARQHASSAGERVSLPSAPKECTRNNVAGEGATPRQRVRHPPRHLKCPGLDVNFPREQSPRRTPAQISKRGPRRPRFSKRSSSRPRPHLVSNQGTGRAGRSREAGTARRRRHTLSIQVFVAEEQRA